MKEKSVEQYPSIYPSLIFCVVLLLISPFIVRNVAYLLWNIFLALVPFYLSIYLEKYSANVDRKNYLQIIVFFLWFIFLPNTFYVLTDFFHIKANLYIPNGSALIQFSSIYNLLLVASFIWTSFLVGIISLRKVHLLINQRYSEKIGIYAVYVTVLCSSIGIYLGRILRLNSWDLIVAPFKFFDKLLYSSRNYSPFQATIFVMVLTAFILVIYSTFYIKNSQKK